jgi:tRNA 2-thiouridine synthesizing protein E
MLDINKAIKDPSRYASDPEGHMSELAPWSPHFVIRQAEQFGLELTEEHWDVIFYLRERYREHGNEDSARIVLRDLEEHFSERHGRGHLYDLFPHGPVTQACQLAGLPQPPHTSDPSFGSVM